MNTIYFNISKISKYLALLLFLFGSVNSLLAQDPRLMPPVAIPQPQYLKAEPKLRIYRTALVPIGPSWAFETTFEAFAWMGLDDSENPINYNIPRGSELIDQQKADKFVRYTRSLTGNAYIYSNYDTKKILRIRFEIPDASKDTTIKIGPIQGNFRILPGVYRIVIEINLAVQSLKNRKILWVDRDVITATGSTEILRVSPLKLPTLTETSLILVGDYKDDKYDFVQSGAVNYYLNALQMVKDIDWLKKSIEEVQKAYNNPTEFRFKRLLPTIRRKQLELADSYFFKQNKEEIAKELKIAKEKQQKINEYLVDYNSKQTMKAVDFAKDLQGLYLEMWWIGNLCLPKWEPAKEIGTLEELRKKWKISRFLKGPMSSTEVQGKWDREAWLKWMKEEWEPKIDTLFNKFRLFFGDEKFAEDHNWHYGLNEYSVKSFWVPKKQNTYERMRYLFKENLLQRFAQAQANLLVEFHSDKDSEIKYPFVARDGKRPSPFPRDAKRYFQTIKDIRKKFTTAFAKKAKTQVDDLSKLPKRKYYVHPTSGYVGPNPICPFTGEKCEGPFDESVLNPLDDPDEE